jgi:hypothetical protein
VAGRFRCAWLLVGAIAACKTSTPGGGGQPEPDAAAAGDPADAAAAVCTPPPGDSNGKLVRVVFLVPSDREANLTYVANLEHALRTTQLWLADKMPGGTSFRVHEPPVEVFATAHAADWYATTPNPPEQEDPTHWFWFNALEDGFEVTGGTWDDPDNIWIFYIQADRDCGQADGGVAGVALLPENDLRGLAGEEIVPLCEDDVVDGISRCRWVGGMLLRIMNALELPPPLACTDEDDATPCNEDIVTRGGFKTFPDATLSDDQLDYLDANPFVRAVGLPDCALECAEPIAP